MDKKHICIDGMAFPITSGTSFSFNGVFSGKELAGIELSFTVYGSQQENIIENILKKEKVTVNDPFTDRTYEATVRMRSNSFQVGKEEKSYVIVLNEIDLLPPVDSVEIDGIKFQVLRYEESISSGEIGRRALLKLSKGEFDQLHKLFENSSIKFKRIGIDKTPLELRFGALMYWSQHIDENEEYFKQIVRLFPLELEPKRFDVASGTTQAAIAHMLISLSARFELLVKELAANQSISNEKRDALLSSGWRDLFPSEQISHLYDMLDQVEDAEKKF